jgi:hypothetical protein
MKERKLAIHYKFDKPEEFPKGYILIRISDENDQPLGDISSIEELNKLDKKELETLNIMVNSTKKVISNVIEDYNEFQTKVSKEIEDLLGGGLKPENAGGSCG